MTSHAPMPSVEGSAAVASREHLASPQPRAIVKSDRRREPRPEVVAAVMPRVTAPFRLRVSAIAADIAREAFKRGQAL